MLLFIKKLRLYLFSFFQTITLLETDYFKIKFPKCIALDEQIEFPSDVLVHSYSDVVLPASINKTLFLKAEYASSYYFFDLINKQRENSEPYIFVIKKKNDFEFIKNVYL